jgi:hypothetical protein
MASKRGVHAGAVTFLAVDVEMHERSKDKEVLEIGLAWTKGSSVWPKPAIFCRHFVIRDHLSLHNGRFVPDNRDRFNFGRSECIDQSELCVTLARLLKDVVHGDEQTYLLGHSVHHDLEWLRGLGVQPNLSKLTVCDIGQAYQAKHSALQLTSLAGMMEHLGLPYRNLHNAANDAYYSLLVGLQMMATEDQTQYRQVVDSTALL